MDELVPQSETKKVSRWGKVKGYVDEKTTDRKARPCKLFDQLKHLGEDVAILKLQLDNDRRQRSAKIINDRMCKSVYTLDREHRFKLAQQRERSLLRIRELAGEILILNCAYLDTFYLIPARTAVPADFDPSKPLRKGAQGLAEKKLLKLVRIILEDIKVCMPPCDAYVGLLQPEGDKIRFVVRKMFVLPKL